MEKSTKKNYFDNDVAWLEVFYCSTFEQFVSVCVKNCMYTVTTSSYF